jgi:ABC-type amino acid transport substrate-binding protein
MMSSTEALATGKIDVVVDDSPIALHFSRAVPGLDYAGPFDGTAGEYAVMLRQGNTELRDRINLALGEMESDGSLAALRTFWFQTEDTVIA